MSPRYDLSSVKLGKLLEDPEAKVIVDRLVPGLQQNPMYGFIKGMAVATVLQVAGSQIGPETVEQLRTEITALQD